MAGPSPDISLLGAAEYVAVEGTASQGNQVFGFPLACLAAAHGGSAAMSDGDRYGWFYST